MMHKQSGYRPLADRLRPQDISEVIGQQHLLAEKKPLRLAVESGHLHSMVFWGPPGTGKTSLARLLSQHADAEFITISAVLGGVKDIRSAIELAKQTQQISGRHTVLFIDEVHRFNKAQQDAFLPHIEDGTITFVGATTENPSFELNNALLSRLRVYVLKALGPEQIHEIINRALLKLELQMDREQRDLLAVAADGDARKVLNLLEITTDLAEEGVVSKAHLEQVLAGGLLRRFDKGGEAFYDQISALHKSVRGSDPDASLYWFARMIDGGCDPLYIARRVVRIASEDIGNADPRGLQLALDAWEVQERLGSPEGELAIAQAIIYLACAAKSNAVYKAWNAALADVKQHGSLEVPLHLRNAPTSMMKSMDYGREYRYAHDQPNAYVAGENYFPDTLKGRQYYMPSERGLEIKISEKLAYLKKLDKKISGA